MIFERRDLDLWILEIGLGGRLDAVNIIDPSVSIITSIGLDHQLFLGDNIESIAREKAGVMRKSQAHIDRSNECAGCSRGRGSGTRGTIDLAGYCTKRQQG